METLDGRCALVTGASSGIGAATAIKLASLGAKVALVARRRELLEGVMDEIHSSGGQAITIDADLSDRNSAGRVISQVISNFGQLGIVVNNAGVMLNGPVEGAPLNEWERMVSLNILGTLYVAHAALPFLLKDAEQNRSKVADMVNVSSVAGRKARRGAGVYNLTKFGINAFSESLREEVTARHVRVSVIEPGATATELPTHQRPEIQAQSKERFGKIERLEAEDVAESIAYIVTRPRRVSISEILVRPTGMEF